ncbi:MAG TPA: hypothetical protein VHK28_02205 [Candidatus Limnocylindria bacterium]|nr:hypothetical protein [Candidatus Limnocylindria bacterium]
MTRRERKKMVDMLDYRLHYAVMATEDRVREHSGRRPANPLRPRLLLRRENSRRRG